MLWTIARVVIEEKDVEIAANIYEKQFSRFTDAYDGLKWRLARNGDQMGLRSSAGGYKLYRQDGDPIVQTPSIIVVFTCGDQRVVIVGLRVEAYVGGADP